MPTSVISRIRWRPGCTTMLLLLASEPVLADFSGQVSLTSEYINRGITWSNGNPAIQIGVDYANDSGFFIGTWASTVDQSNANGRRNIEVDYYIGYSFAEDATFPTAVSIIHYSYPDDSSDFDYDYSEAALTTSWKNYSLEYGYASDLYGFGFSSHRFELRGDWNMPNAWVIGAGLGYLDLDVHGSAGRYFWDAGISARFSRITIDLRWHDREARAGFASRWDAGSQTVVTLSSAF